jgi:hypothetical protein
MRISRGVYVYFGAVSIGNVATYEHKRKGIKRDKGLYLFIYLNKEKVFLVDLKLLYVIVILLHP